MTSHTAQAVLPATATSDLLVVSLTLTRGSETNRDGRGADALTYDHDPKIGSRRSVPSAVSRCGTPSMSTMEFGALAIAAWVPDPWATSSATPLRLPICLSRDQRTSPMEIHPGGSLAKLSSLSVRPSTSGTVTTRLSRL